MNEGEKYRIKNRCSDANYFYNHLKITSKETQDLPYPLVNSFFISDTYPCISLNQLTPTCFLISLSNSSIFISSSRLDF